MAQDKPTAVDWLTLALALVAAIGSAAGFWWSTRRESFAPLRDTVRRVHLDIVDAASRAMSLNIPVQDPTADDASSRAERKVVFYELRIIAHGRARHTLDAPAGDRLKEFCALLRDDGARVDHGSLDAANSRLQDALWASYERVAREGALP